MKREWLLEGSGAEGTIVLAKWSRRLAAWFIDLLIVGVPANLLIPAGMDINILFPFFSWPSFFLFVYWVVLENYRGQSVGKMALGIKVTRLDGSSPSLVESAIQSFGKAILLPIDLIVGLLLSRSREKRQRLFNLVSRTIVIRKERAEEEAKGLTYVKE